MGPTDSHPVCVPAFLAASEGSSLAQGQALPCLLLMDTNSLVGVLGPGWLGFPLVLAEILQNCVPGARLGHRGGLSLQKPHTKMTTVTAAIPEMGVVPTAFRSRGTLVQQCSDRSCHSPPAPTCWMLRMFFSSTPQLTKGKLSHRSKGPKVSRDKHSLGPNINMGTQ